MVTERTKQKLLDLYDSVIFGDLSSKGEVSKQMFLSRAEVIIIEEFAEITNSFIEKLKEKNERE